MKKRHFKSSMIIASLAMSAVPFTSAMATETASIRGDNNVDRSFGIADVVLMLVYTVFAQILKRIYIRLNHEWV